jgi:hypothetical protein
MMDHLDRSIHQSVIALAEKGELSVTTAGELQCPKVYCKYMATEIL